MTKPLANLLSISVAPGRSTTSAVMVLRAALHWPRTWLHRSSYRRELAELDARQMRDAGLDPDLVRREAGKPFWRA